jgi:pimeloyl-ACP methyl ester carboxylesterase
MKRAPFRTSNIELSVAEAGHGRPFIFQHGLCGDATQTQQVFPDGTGFRCITVECRGHGQSESGNKENLSIETFASDIVRFVQERRLEKLVLGGISMGAAIALRIAVRYPELVKALVIVRPAWLDSAAPINMHPNAFAGELIDSNLPGEALRTFDASVMAGNLKNNGPDNLNSIRGFFSREPLSITAALLRQISSDGPGVSEADIRNIDCPALIIGNRLDFVHPLAYAHTLSGWIRDSRFIEIASKADSPGQYRSELRAALASFLEHIER